MVLHLSCQSYHQVTHITLVLLELIKEILLEYTVNMLSLICQVNVDIVNNVICFVYHLVPNEVINLTNAITYSGWNISTITVHWEVMYNSIVILYSLIVSSQYLSSKHILLQYLS